MTDTGHLFILGLVTRARGMELLIGEMRKVPPQRKIRVLSPEAGVHITVA